MHLHIWMHVSQKENKIRKGNYIGNNQTFLSKKDSKVRCLTKELDIFGVLIKCCQKSVFLSNKSAAEFNFIHNHVSSVICPLMLLVTSAGLPHYLTDTTWKSHPHRLGVKLICIIHCRPWQGSLNEL